MARPQHSYVRLCPETPARFEPAINKDTAVFFDECNRQIFVVKEGEYDTSVNVTSLNRLMCMQLRVTNRGQIISIKLSSDQSVLGLQCSARNVTFINLGNRSEFTMTPRRKNAQVLGFNWTSDTDVVLITTSGFELYSFMGDKRVLLKSIHQNVHWFAYAHEARVLALATGDTQTVLQPFLFRPGGVERLGRVDVQTSVSSSTSGNAAGQFSKPATKLAERDITLGVVYGRLYCFYVRNGLAPPALGERNAGLRTEIVLYEISREPATKRAALYANARGKFALNIVDNLILLHHQESKTTRVFDLKLASAPEPVNSNGAATAVDAVAYDVSSTSSLGGYGNATVASDVLALSATVAPMSIAPFRLRSADGSAEEEVALYAQTWVVFQPNVIIDARLGALWELDLCLEEFVPLFADKVRVVDFLLQRHGAENVILNVCRNALESGTQVPLSTTARIFDQLNSCYRSSSGTASPLSLVAPTSAFGGGYSGTEFARSLPSPTSLAPIFANGSTVHNAYGERSASGLEQTDLYTHVFAPLEDDSKISYKYLVAVVVEYIRSLNQFRIPVQHFLYELVINLLVRHNRYYQLHQFLQYHVVNDSKHVACLLLSLESSYPPAYQLALDMLKRVSNAKDEIVDVLLGKGHVLAALRYVRANGLETAVSSKQFLDAVMETAPNDDMLFYTVYKFFERRNFRFRSKIAASTNPMNTIDRGTDGVALYADQFRERFAEIRVDATKGMT